MKVPAGLRAMSLANLTVWRVDPVEFINGAADAGFGAVGLLLLSPTPQPLEHGIVGRPEVIRAVRAALQARGLRCFDIEAFVLQQGASLERFRPALAVGAELGATHISSIGAEPRGADTGLTAAERVDLFGRLCDEAARFGLQVGVEFMRYRDIPTWREALDLIEAAGRPNSGLIVDALHLFRSGGTPQDIAGIPAPRIAYAQLCDARPDSPAFADLPAEARGDRLALGTGAIPLAELIKALPEGTKLVVETPIREQASWSVIRRCQSAGKTARVFFEKPGKITSP